MQIDVEPVPRRRYQPGPLLAECHRPARSQAPVYPKWTHGRRVVAITAPAGSATCAARYRPTSHSVALATVIHSGGRELARSALCSSQPQKKKRPGCSLPAGSFLFGAYRIIRRTPTSTASTAATTPSNDRQPLACPSRGNPAMKTSTTTHSPAESSPSPPSIFLS
jgi:hypothetical protein